jgi:hypothetical protein
VLLAQLLPALRAIPTWGSLLTLGPLSLAVFAAASLVIMPHLLRNGWAVMRGRSDKAPQPPQTP